MGGFNPGVHGARGLFSAMVFVYHVHHSGLPGIAAVAGTAVETVFLSSMRFGVELFFGISGIVIVGALRRSPSTASFAWDRITRILPTLWATLFVITTLYIIDGRALPPLGEWLANFLAPPPMFEASLLHPAAWSLGYEFTFYALCAGAWSLRRGKVRAWLWIGCVVGALLTLLYPRAILIGAGVMIAAAVPRPRVIDALARYPFAMLVLFLVTWRCIDIAADGHIRTLSPVQHDVGQWALLAFPMLLAGIMGGIALLGICRGHGWLGHFLRLPATQWLGTISYSFYLWHPICMAGAKLALARGGFVDALGQWSQLALLLLALPPSLAAAHWSQKLIEDRFTRWLRRFGPNSPHKRMAPAMPAGATKTAVREVG